MFIKYYDSHRKPDDSPTKSNMSGFLDNIVQVKIPEAI